VKRIFSINYLFILLTAFTFFSCGVSINIAKRQYRPGIYCNISRTKYIIDTVKTQEEISSSLLDGRPAAVSLVDAVASSGNSFPVPAKKVLLDQSNSKTIVHQISFPKNKKTAEQKIKDDDKPPEKPARSKALKTAKIFLIAGLIGFLFILLLSFIPIASVQLLNVCSFIAAIGILCWPVGIILAIIGVVKTFKKNKSPIVDDTKHLDKFSKISLPLLIVSFIDLLLLIVATLLSLFIGFNLLIASAIILFVLFTLGFIASTLGLIRTLSDVNQPRKNIVKAIMLAILNVVPIALALAWIIAVGMAIQAAIPFLAVALLILHG
jgi:hypothetical protein